MVAGAGKTMLMDLFYESAQVEKKQRVHFNSFMLDVHDSKPNQEMHGREEAVYQSTIVNINDTGISPSTVG